MLSPPGIVTLVVETGTPPHQLIGSFQLLPVMPSQLPAGVTAMITVSGTSDGIAEQFKSNKLVMLYDVVVAGVTVTVIEGAVPLKASPLLSKPLIKPAPVTVRVRLVGLPAHMVVAPAILAVGRAFNDTNVLSDAEHPSASVTVTLYHPGIGVMVGFWLVETIVFDGDLHEYTGLKAFPGFTERLTGLPKQIGELLADTTMNGI